MKKKGADKQKREIGPGNLKKEVNECFHPSQ
jgi:hypothetical protein